MFSHLILTTILGELVSLLPTPGNFPRSRSFWVGLGVGLALKCTHKASVHLKEGGMKINLGLVFLSLVMGIFFSY